ncbi:hypothetical protein J7E93_21855 [Streptomyces sp. ISL-36]|uniref:hypothetical protein n=1 Tax=Streptomyces sp. ISL-36 TaxID=2819182 RepID=UPI001BE85AC7|nr:hypothetical protein [Streptomyces sp. ISL-36]MBT2442704.1 hypothetical protein [Streptomyces sp. ISL-36]
MSPVGSPRTVRGGIVLLDPTSGAVRRVITLQYNPDTVARSFQVRGAGGDAGAKAEALRLTGPPAQTITLDAEFDAADQLEFPEANRTVVEVGLRSQLALLETIVYPTVDAVRSAAALAAAGALEVIPPPTPLTLFVWSKHHITPVRITEFSITEESFDTQLNPVRAKVHLGLRVSTVNDVGVGTLAGSLAMTHHQRLEQLASRQAPAGIAALGIGGVS